MSLELRDYQKSLVDDTRTRLRKTKKVLMQAPTGAGKTAMASYMSLRSYQRGKRLFFIVHRAELVEQTSRTFTRFGLMHSFVAAGREFDPSDLVFICSIDTLKTRVKKLAAQGVTPDFLIWDECHHLGAAGWTAVMQSYPDAFHVGLSATPCRLDGSGLDSHFGDMSLGPSVEWLIEHGHLSPYRCFAPSKPDLKGVRTQAGDYKTAELEEVMSKPRLVGDAVEHWKRHAAGLRTVVFAVSVKHSQHIVQVFQAAGVPAAHLDGNTPAAERADIIQRFADGELQVLSNVSLFGEGFDLSAVAGRDVTIDCVMLLRPTQSLSLFLQQVGRALRPAPGKVAIILDHAGNTQRHGLPDDQREWSLKGRDKKAKRESDGPPPPVTCEGCYTQIRRPAPPKCPHCGTPLVTPIELPKHTKAELVEIKRAEREAAKAAKAAEKAAREAAAEEARRQRKAEERACTTLDELVELGKRRGYDYPKGWAEKRFGSLKYRDNSRYATAR